MELVAKPLHEIKHDFREGEKRMKRLITLVAVIACLTVFMVAADAQWSNTLWGQEGGLSDGYAPVDPKGDGYTGPTGTVADNLANFKYQYGSGSWSGIYSWDTDAWQEEATAGDESIDVECDIEMYYASTTSNNKIYFHIGNPFTATTSEKTAYVDGTYAANNGQYVGISFAGTVKDASSFEGDGSGGYTGVVLGGMVGDTDAGGRDISDKGFDIRFLLSTTANSSGYLPPTSFGAGSHGTQQSVLWWSPVVTGLFEGSYNLSWQVRIMPPADQPDGNYHLDPVIVASPVL
jgi:hypothetical protein